MPEELEKLVLAKELMKESPEDYEKLRAMWNTPNFDYDPKNLWSNFKKTYEGRVGEGSVPIPKVTKEVPLVRGQDAAKQLMEYAKIAPNLLGKFSGITVGPNASMMDSLFSEYKNKFQPHEAEKLNLMGQFDRGGDRSIYLNPALRKYGSLFEQILGNRKTAQEMGKPVKGPYMGSTMGSTLAHELTHAAGYPEEPATEVGDLIKMFRNRINK